MVTCRVSILGLNSGGLRDVLGREKSFHHFLELGWRGVSSPPACL